MTDEYYNNIAEGYDELHKEEQLLKLAILKQHLTITKDTTLLDVGCGTGVSSQFDCDVTGVDPSEELIKIAEKKLPIGQFFVEPAEDLTFEDHSFDVVISLTAIQNFEDIEKGISEIKRVGKEQFGLSYLKKSLKSKFIEETIRNTFSEFKIERIEEDKDIIFIIKK